MIIGLTGTKASGKTEIASFLQKHGYSFFSLSDMVREEAVNRGIIRYTQRDLQTIGNDLRKRYGLGILAERIKPQIEKKENAVVDGIRNPGEIIVLRRLPDFYLAGFDADLEVRSERLRKRNRSDDATALEEIKAIDKIDKGEGEDVSGQQVDACLNFVDYIQFTMGTIEEEIDKFKTQFLDLITERRLRRPTFDELFMVQAYDSSKRSTCLSRKVGAVLTLNNHLVGTGYNGSPPGFKHCNEIGECLRKKLNIPSGERHEVCRAIHAEVNALLHTKAVDVTGSVAYQTTSPCSLCARLLIGAGIKKIVYDGSYPDQFALDLIKEANIRIERFSGIRPIAYHKVFK